MELFMEKTMTSDVKQLLDQQQVYKVFCSLSVTDTDSCSFQFNAVCDELTGLSEEWF